MDWVITGCTQGSVLGPLFNIYLNDLFFEVDYTEECNFACDKDLGSLINRLERSSYLAIEWLQNNYMKLNEDKCHLLVGQKLVMQEFGSLIKAVGST